jgi:hypothetical protein
MLGAAEPLAVLTASGDIKLNGKPLPTAGAPNWPLDAGDEVLTGETGAVIAFSDSMRVTLGRDSRLVLQQCGRCVAQFYRGALDYDKPAGSKAEICALGRPVRPAPGSSGSVIAESAGKIVLRAGGEDKVLTTGKCPCNLGAPWAITGMSTGAKAGIAAGVAGAAATAGAIRATRPASNSSTP